MRSLLLAATTLFLATSCNKDETTDTDSSSTPDTQAEVIADDYCTQVATNCNLDAPVKGESNEACDLWCTLISLDAQENIDPVECAEIICLAEAGVCELTDEEMLTCVANHGWDYLL